MRIDSIFFKPKDFLTYVDVECKKYLYFNKIYRNRDSQEKFNDLIPILNKFVNGDSACLISHGISGKIFFSFIRCS